MTAIGEPVASEAVPLGDLVASLSEGLVVADTEGTMLFLNQSAEELLGWAPGELVGRDLTTIVPERLREAHRAAFERHVETGEARLIGHPIRLAARRGDGSEVECDVLLSRHDGPVALLVGTLRPSAPAAATAEARIGRELLSAASERLPRDELVDRVLRAIAHALDCQVAALWVVEPGTDQLRCEAVWSGIESGRFAAVSKGSLFPPGVGLPGRVWEGGRTEWIHDIGSDPRFVRRAAARATGLESGVAFPLTPGGKFTGVMELYSTDRRTESPDLMAVLAGLGAVLGTFLDRAHVEEERQRLLDQIQTERSLLDAVLRQLPEGVVIVSPEMEVILTNTAADRLLGPHAVGDHITIIRPNGTGYDPAELPFASALSSREPPESQELEIVTGDGTVAHVAIRCTPIRDREGRVASVVATIDDVTEDRRDRQRLELLAEASEIVAMSLDAEEALRAITRVSVPAFVDICVADVIDHRGRLRRIALEAATPELEALVERALTEFSAPPALDAGVPRVLRSGEPVVYDHVDDELLAVAAEDATHLDILRRLRPSSAVIVPIVGRGQTLGALTFSALPPRRELSGADIELAVELGRRTGLAVANSRLYERERTTATELQRSLMPPELPDVAGIDVGACFEPGAEGLQIGGDFYDVFPISDRTWALMVGDVCGKGAEAAAVACQVRYTARAVASAGSPAEVLARINRTLLATGPTRFCTMLFAVLEVVPGGVSATIAAAGHPPPAVVGARGQVSRLDCGGTLLGVVPDVTHPEVVVALHDDDALVLFTDGVTEAHDGSTFFGEHGVHEVLARSKTRGSAQEIAGSVAGAAVAHGGGQTRDDVAVLVAKVRPPNGRS